MPILFWQVQYKENMKKNDHHSNVGALKIRNTTQSNGVKFQHNKNFNRCYLEENAFWNSLLSKRMLSIAIRQTVYHLIFSGSFRQTMTRAVCNKAERK